MTDTTILRGPEPDPVLAMVQAAREAWERVGAAEKAEDQKLVDEALGVFQATMDRIQERRRQR